MMYDTHSFALHSSVLKASCLSFNQVAQEIWVCEKKTITKWTRGILAYKEHLKSKIAKQAHDL